MPHDPLHPRDPKFTFAPSSSAKDPNSLPELSCDATPRAAGTSVVAWSLVVVMAVALIFFALLAIAPLKSQLHEVQALLVAANHDNVALSAEVDAHRKGEEVLLRERDGLAHQVAVARQGPEAVTRIREKIEAVFSQELGASTAWVAQKEFQIALTLSDTLLFAGAERDLTVEGEQLLERLLAIVSAPLQAGALLDVQAHVDTTPISASLKRQAQDAWHLSAARAASVVVAMGTQEPLAGRHLLASGAGNSRPIASNAEEAGRRRNRRVVFILTLPEPA